MPHFLDLAPVTAAGLRRILDDPEASDNDRFVALELLINATIAARRELPGCQDTGTAIAIGHKGESVVTFADDALDDFAFVFILAADKDIKAGW